VQALYIDDSGRRIYTELLVKEMPLYGHLKMIPMTR
jgi:hypothetical protein